ncbi:InlB B-repeat-containing protein [Faecalibacterium prausnitzii]|uniref:InlB B-repeat-containing protein n=1 Tax=Faecalibacterium TaxID=216851 RepID=UPI0032EB9E1B
MKCSNVHMRSLDVSKNLKLETLWCYWNNLEQLDVSKNKALKELRCGYNNLTTLNVSQNKALELLSTNEMRSKLNSLDVSYNKALNHLECTKNGLTSLDVSSNEALERLVCDGNPLTELDVSKNDKLTSLSCRRCGLTSLKFGSAVSSMECEENQLTELDISQNTRWTDLRCNDNKLTSLSFNENVVMPPVASINTYNNRYQIAVDADGIYDLSQLPGGFDVSKTSDWTNGELNGTKLKVTPGSTTVTYKYNTGSAPHTGRRTFNLDVHWHNYQWQHDGTKHWRECTTANCPGLTAEQVAKTTHDYTDATDPDCNTCGYVRSMYTVTTGENVTAELEDKVLDAPVAADTKVHLTATVPEGQHFTGWTVKVGGEEQKADTFLTPDKNDPTKATFTMPSKNVEVTANFASNPTLNPTLRVGDHVTATIEGSDASVPSGSTVPVPKNKIVHLTAIAPDGQHFTGWTVKVGSEEQKADTFLKTPDASDPTKVTFTMPDADVEVTATFAGDSIPEPDPVGPSDTGNIQGALSAVVIGAAAGAIIYEAGTGIYRVINMPGIPMPSNRIELAELLWEHAGKPEPVSTALYSDIDEGDTDAQKAARWAVEQDLMKDDADNNKFHPAFPVSKLRTCLTWNAAKEKGLFDKTEE